MSELNKKLNSFTSLVLNDAQNKCDMLLDKLKQEHDTIIDAKENEILEQAYQTVRHGVSEAKKASNAKILHAELEAKKQLLITRENIITDVFENVESRLREYMKTDEYAKWLVEKINSACTELGDGKKTVYVSADDIKLKDKITAAVSDDIFVEEIQDSKYIGGVRVFNTDRHISIDYSFNEMLENEKQSFLQESDLVTD